jgi:hypothetical protein
MDWRAALALVKSQQLLLNDVLKESAAVPGPEEKQPHKRALISPAPDAFPDQPRPEVADEPAVEQRAKPKQTERPCSATDDDDTMSEGSSCVAADDIIGTPRPQDDDTNDLSPLVRALSEGRDAPLVPIPVVFCSAASFVDAVLGDEAQEGAADVEEPPAAQRDSASAVVRATAEERKTRVAVEREEDMEALRLWSTLARALAALECRCAAEHSLLDAAASEVATLEAYRRRYMATCAAEFQATMPA